MDQSTADLRNRFLNFGIDLQDPMTFYTVWAAYRIIASLKNDMVSIGTPYNNAEDTIYAALAALTPPPLQ
jgi:hypothetical protein